MMIHVDFGNIFYGHGLAVLTSDSTIGGGFGYGNAIYGLNLYGESAANEVINNLVSSSNVTCSFSSSLTIYETQYKCTLCS